MVISASKRADNGVWKSVNSIKNIYKSYLSHEQTRIIIILSILNIPIYYGQSTESLVSFGQNAPVNS